MQKAIHTYPLSVVYNLLLVYICYMICRVEFVADNWILFSQDLDGALIWSIFKGALRFDTSAILYTNLLYILIVLLPLHYKETKVMQTVAKWAYIIPNALAIIVNMMDSVYFPYSMRRTTMTVFKEFGDNTNIGEVIGIECLHHWYLVLLGALLIYLLYRCYATTDIGVSRWNRAQKKHYYIIHSIVFVIAVPLIIMGLRGNRLGHINRPISTILANDYVNKPEQAGIVVNTPFSLIRSSKKSDIKVPAFYADLAAAESVFSPVHYPADSITERRKNVVIILVESLSEEFVGAMNRKESGDAYATLTPFIDSLYKESLTFEQSFANGWMSTDGIPLVQASLPKMYNGYTTSQYALNETPGIAKELSNMGYHSAYFHGAEDASLGLKGSARSTGIEDYFGMEQYVADPRTGGKADYDGTWGIWDEEFMQYFCMKLDEMPQPFIATLFTLNSHHPFSMPKKYEKTFPNDEPKYPVKRCIRYTDYSLRRFFDSAKQQPWYANTLFVITADHCYHNIIRDGYRNALGQFRIPIMWFDPSGSLPKGTHEGIAQQLDIMPTILGYLGYDQPYVAYGKDLLNTPAEETWAFQYQDIPQLVKGDYLIQMQGFKLSGVYRYKSDFSLKHNLLETGDYDKEYVAQMESQLKAILQSADTRLRDNTLRKVEITNSNK